MECPACGASIVPFAVPEAYQPMLPEPASGATLCPTCLMLTPFDAAAPPPGEAEFSRILDSFPEGDAGAAMVIATGLLVESLALNRDEVRELFEAVSDAGHDPWLVVERLAAAGSVQPDADLGKLRHQLEQLWD
ncbi:MAG: DUF6276 family protein [Halobacteriales archaeon]